VGVIVNLDAGRAQGPMLHAANSKDATAFLAIDADPA
jgi:hypothetical protein